MYRKRLVIQFSMIIIAVLEMAHYWFDKVYFNREIAGDVSEVWIPFANAVLEGGILYLSHWDNKPPLFHFLNIIAAASGHYLLVFYLTIGLANGVAAILIWRFCNKYGYDAIGLVAAIIFLAFMSISSFRINPRQYATVLIFMAILSTNALRSGIYIASAGLFSQFSALMIPAILWFRYRKVENFPYWFGMFILAGMGTVLFVFGIVAFIWNIEAAITGFKYSFLSSSEYVARYGQRDISIYADPIGWLYNTHKMLRSWRLLQIGAIAGSGVVLITEEYNRSGFGTMVVICALLSFFQMTIRPAPVYSVAWTPFFAILTTITIDRALSN